jgi:hypothetical protein
MTWEERRRAVQLMGFTERQAGFLVTVMLYAGVCLGRQYCTFGRIAYGQKMHDFFQSLLSRGRVAPPSSGGPALGRSSLMERGIAGIVFGGWTTPGACASPAS